MFLNFWTRRSQSQLFIRQNARWFDFERTVLPRIGTRQRETLVDGFKRLKCHRKWLAASFPQHNYVCFASIAHYHSIRRMFHLFLIRWLKSEAIVVCSLWNKCEKVINFSFIKKPKMKFEINLQKEKNSLKFEIEEILIFLVDSLHHSPSIAST